MGGPTEERGGWNPSPFWLPAVLRTASPELAAFLSLNTWPLLTAAAGQTRQRRGKLAQNRGGQAERACLPEITLLRRAGALTAAC